MKNILHKNMTTISERTFKVFNSTNQENNIIEFFVTDMSEDELKKEQHYYKHKIHGIYNEFNYKGNEYYRQRVATFPVSNLYDEHSQRIRAEMLKDYMNKIQEATNKAIRNTNMIDSLSIT